MTKPAKVSGTDKRQRRVSYQRAGSRETKAALAQAALALWRTNGYASTTVADICKAAGVSRALFYFYFPGKEDLLFEVGVLSTHTTRQHVRALVEVPYELESVIFEALDSLGRSMSRNPPELIVETVLEGYRRQRPDTISPEDGLLHNLFTKAKEDGKIAGHVEIGHLSRLAQILITEGARHWATGAYGSRSFADAVTADICVLVAGFNHPPPDNGSSAVSTSN
ncbi:TetR/AcrR family transcriptional regulator [Nocardia sp. NPDC005366]|uniref:TetR/AcrR family transcriptional regulator n=1 Tax=Nocardia sp. NPDC005366 TaxID=3156878 RepID=UPI0033A9EAF3